MDKQDKQRILITVKTYPTLSKKYGETVCTAGLREDGSWVRIYPVPFRLLEKWAQYRRYDWLECQLVKNTSDPRPESYRPAAGTDLVPAGHVGTDDQWRERRRIVLGCAQVYNRMDELIENAKANEASLAVFKPAKVTDFVWEADEREWDPQKLRQMRSQYNQYDLFDDNSWRETFRVVNKLPYNFSYKFEDATGKPRKLQILDWEVGALYWNCLRGAKGNEPEALAKVRQRYFDDFTTKDLHFYLGTTQEWHQRSPNPWVIIGVLPIPPVSQLGLF
ncbi:MAG: hypothetical protein RBU30_09660 [Polyangia bacterium]|jgi:hypothetical protein|nr:hypothetical protein [Polyangia bacterium]